jgi:hypothetical protein
MKDQSKPCYFPGMGSPHDAHDRSDGTGWCPGYSEPEEGITEPAPPQTVAEQVRDLERIIERVREAVGTDQPAAASDGREAELLRNEIGRLKELIGWMRTALCEAFGIPDDESIDVVGSAQGLLDEARNWARHGYEIGQKHCGWTDHGVAPAWLTEGWPPHIDSCEHAQQASEYDSALTKVRSLPTHPEVMDAQHPDPSGYLHGYKVAIGDAKRAARVNSPKEDDREPDRRAAQLNEQHTRNEEGR